ncbi:MAG: aspartate/glutamate racemase family protein [Dehalococcoidales bacterium]
MAQKVGMVHSVASLVPLFNELAAELLPGVEVIHLVDEGLLKDVLASGQLTPSMARRFGLLATFAEESGAEIVMLTCSSLAPLVDQSRDTVKVPLLKVDEAMADEAVGLGERIGVIATAYTTLKPTSDLIKERAALQDKKVAVEAVLCEGAFEALRRGELESHDRTVKEKLNELMEQVDVVVLAQASIARTVAQIPENERKVPILSSPRLGVQRLKEKLESLGK